jgi:hypothetical protein
MFYSVLFVSVFSSSALSENVEAIQLLDNVGIISRLQRKKPFELV